MEKPYTPAFTPARAAARKIAPGEKPFEDFPLHWHKTGRWRKKFRGRHYYFNADAVRSYDEWKVLEDSLLSGEAPPAERGRRPMVLQHAIDTFLAYQHNRFARDEIGPAQMGKYVKEIKIELPKSVSANTRLEDFCDDARGPALFAKIRAAAIRRGLQVAERHVVYVRAMFDLVSKRGENYLCAPPLYGEEFAKPTQGQIEKEKFGRSQGDTVWTFAEAAELIQTAVRRDIHLYAQLVLMAIGGYTSADVSALPLSAIDRKNGIINFPRVKNFRRRLCPLIPPLLNAIDASLKLRAKPASVEFEHLAFLTRQGTPLNVVVAKTDRMGDVTGTRRKDVLNLRLRRLCDTLDTNRRDALKGKSPKARKALGTAFVSLRRKGQGQKTFRTLNYRAAIGAGVHDDFIAVLRGRRFNRPIEDYYLRNDLRGELEKLAVHIAKTFKIPTRPPKSPGCLRYHGPTRPLRTDAEASAGPSTAGASAPKSPVPRPKPKRAPSSR